ncbi:hypothetical protein [Desulfocastanea catecholica]
MKKKITIFAIILCVVSTSSAFARGYNNVNHGGHHYRSDYYQHRGGGGHRNNGLGLAFGLVGGLLLGSALVSAATPPPGPVVYGVPHTTYQPYQPVVVAPPPRICVEDRVVGGEWQVSRYDGRQVWVSFPYPVTQRVQVPCY